MGHGASGLWKIFVSNHVVAQDNKENIVIVIVLLLNTMVVHVLEILKSSFLVTGAVPAKKVILFDWLFV